MHGNVVSTCLALLAWSGRVRASSYSDITDSAQFLTQLGLTQAQESRLSKGLRGIDLDAVSGLSPTERSSVTCLVANAVFGSQIVGQSTSNYDELVEVNWSSACWFEPQCIIQPASAQDVSKAMLIVTYLGTKFAIRSGGHNPNPGFAGIGEEGVLLDMSHMTDVTLSKDGSVASLAPGIRFGAVDTALNAKGKTVHGGRINYVGVGGYLLGGGLTYFNSKYGLAADNIVNYEVVLANSSIINANAQTNSDLWWALKGTGTNFGVVTKYDVKTTENGSYWFEGLYYAPEQNLKLLDAIVEYAHAAENDPNAAISFTLSPKRGFVEFIYAKPVERPSTYSMFYDIPSTGHGINSTIGNMVDMNNEISAINPETYKRRMIASTSHRFDATTLKDIFAEYLIFDSEARKFGAATGIVIQPFTSAAVQHSASTGGNPVGLKEGLQNHMAYSLEWADNVNDEAARVAITKLTEKVEAITKARGLYLETKIMNDAGYNQNVLASFGPKNLKRLRDIASRYDPTGVFQTLQNNGFLLKKA
ncbi:putative FAD binding domain-containing protein [Rosellinia necatrix]|uniref:Putative FAD binding domain-containing protein n=1 Tax=Rosellinia necatrix TaxID=77044 RepID=A0A1W2TN21_ROSNE|nr:putative FAD binding domain-containing protein [Rosellinia necatrix]